MRKNITITTINNETINYNKIDYATIIVRDGILSFDFQGTKVNYILCNVIKYEVRDYI